jgi:7-cyano-7-deazaguanine synthase
MTAEALVLHSGGMDSSICLLIAKQRFGSENVLSVGFRYGQRHASELEAAEEIANHFGIRRAVLDLPMVPGWEGSSLLSHSVAIQMSDSLPNSFVPGRNGLFLMMAAPLARSLGAHHMYIGVMEQEGAFSGYPDCHRAYIDAVEGVVRLDLQDPMFSIQTPLVSCTKAQTLEIASSFGVLDYLLEHTVTCYNGLRGRGCGTCPACTLRQAGEEEYYQRRSSGGL